MAAITDKFNKAANGTGAYPSVASVTAVRDRGGSVLACDDLTGWNTSTAVHFSTYRLMSDGAVDTSTQSDWKGIVSGNTITQMTWLAGNKDSGHSVGDKVELNPTIGWLDDLITGILKSHNQDGTLKDGVVSTSKVADSAITATKIATKAVKSPNIDWATMKQTASSTSLTNSNGTFYDTDINTCCCDSSRKVGSLFVATSSQLNAGTASNRITISTAFRPSKTQTFPGIITIGDTTGSIIGGTPTPIVATINTSGVISFTVGGGWNNRRIRIIANNPLVILE